MLPMQGLRGIARLFQRSGYYHLILSTVMNSLPTGFELAMPWLPAMDEAGYSGV